MIPILHWQRIGSYWYWANADETTERQYGMPGYEVRKFSRGWRVISPDEKILVMQAQSGKEAFAVAEKDLPMYRRGLKYERV